MIRNLKQRMREILHRLKKTYARTPESFVLWKNPLELVIATVLSAQCTDVRVNKVTQELFKKYKTALAYARAPLPELERAIASVTYFRSKAKYLKGIGQMLEEQFGGQAPRTAEELMALPGVGYKTAQLIVSKITGEHTGVAVDTHVRRVAPRLGLTSHTNPDKIARDLERITLKKDWLAINEYLILHGRAICAPRKPKCPECPLRDICPSARRFMERYWTEKK